MENEKTRGRARIREDEEIACRRDVEREDRNENQHFLCFFSGNEGIQWEGKGGLSNSP